jgi:hypothetical protein
MRLALASRRDDTTAAPEAVLEKAGNWLPNRREVDGTAVRRLPNIPRIFSPATRSMIESSRHCGKRSSSAQSTHSRRGNLRPPEPAQGKVAPPWLRSPRRTPHLSPARFTPQQAADSHIVHRSIRLSRPPRYPGTVSPQNGPAHVSPRPKVQFRAGSGSAPKKTAAPGQVHLTAPPAQLNICTSKKPAAPRQVHPTASSELPNQAKVNVTRPQISTQVPHAPKMERPRSLPRPRSAENGRHGRSQRNPATEILGRLSPPWARSRRRGVTESKLTPTFSQPGSPHSK